MVRTAALDESVGILGNLFYQCLFFSPIPTFYNIYKCSVEDFSPNPYLVTVLNCALMVYHGIIHSYSLVITDNGIGLILESIYVSLYLTYSSKKQRKSAGIKSLIGFVTFIGLALSCSLIPDSKLRDRGTAIGVVCDIVSILMYAMPCDQIYYVYKTKSLEYMPLRLSLVGFLNSACWFTYALLHLDPYNIASNGVGWALGIIQLGDYAYYYFKYPKSKNNKTIDDNADGSKVKLS
ncbi:hypothetical protein MKX03_015081 [Papaver bracteatum]|nr:hypothetical protein MKX03_015081 [Papaver bracteatum]